MKTSSIVTAILLCSPAARAGAACPSSVQSALAGNNVKLASCEREQDLYFVLQDYEGEDQPYAGVTLSVYDASSFAPSAKPLAVQTGLGDRVLTFRMDGHALNHWMLPVRDGKPGILFRAFNPPRVGLFVSFRYDPATKSLSLVSDEASTDAGSIPDIRDGTLTVSGESFNEDGVEVPFTKVYDFHDGAFTSP